MSENQENILKYNLQCTREEHPYNGGQKKVFSILSKTEEIKDIYLIVGTFPPSRFIGKGKNVKEGYLYTVDSKNEVIKEVDWYYGSKDNEMWGSNGEKGLLQESLGSNEILPIKESRIEFCKKYGIIFLDLFQTINRYADSALDENIFPLEIVNLLEYLKQYPKIKGILFTSEWVMKIAKKEYLKENKKFLEKLRNKTDNVVKIGNERVSSEYVQKNTFLVQTREDSEDYQEVKIARLTSPSSCAKKTSEEKKNNWKKAFESVDFFVNKK